MRHLARAVAPIVLLAAVTAGCGSDVDPAPDRERTANDRAVCDAAATEDTGGEETSLAVHVAPQADDPQIREQQDRIEPMTDPASDDEAIAKILELCGQSER
jgi:hypothetical protein